MDTITYRNLTFTPSDITEGTCITQHAMTGEKLAYDTLDFTVLSSNPKLDVEFLTSDSKEFYTSNGKKFYCLKEMPLTEFVPRSPLMYHADENLINKFYLKNVVRSAKDLYKFTTVSAIGVLDDSMHYGGIYNGTAITTVLAELLDGITYEVDPVVQTIKLYGWLPYDTKRNNLQQITIATALSIRTKSDGTLRITALSSDSKGTFRKDRVFVGGEVEAGTPCTAVQVTEHLYQAGTESITLYDGSFLTEGLIKFSEPAHSLSITGGTIISSGANYAIVQGSGAVKLTGQKYIHTTKCVTEGTITGDSTDKVLQVKEATLVTSLNSHAVAKKLYDTFVLPSTIKAEVMYDAEHPGDVVNIINPYTDVLENAFMQKVTISLDSFPKVDAEFLIDYLPSGVITGYQHRVILASNQSWTVPAGTEEIRAILVGGGKGGQSGYNGSAGEKGARIPSGKTGADGTWWTYEYNGDGGEGGAAGTGGTGGKVLDTGALAVTPGQAFNAAIGIGGTGGAPGGNAGTSGGNTTFGAYSSGSGTVAVGGYVDIITGTAYGLAGSVGIAGNKGKGKDKLQSGFILVDGSLYYDGNDGQCFYQWISYSDGSKIWLYGMGGSGGGAAYGIAYGALKGADGQATYNDGNGYATGGNGGPGGSPITPGSNATVPGAGGQGGHGGGGGGGGGSYLNPNGSAYEWPGAGGSGGAGSEGGDGMSGCVIIYY